MSELFFHTLVAQETQRLATGLEWLHMPSGNDYREHLISHIRYHCDKASEAAMNRAAFPNQAELESYNVEEAKKYHIALEVFDACRKNPVDPFKTLK